MTDQPGLFPNDNPTPPPKNTFVPSSSVQVVRVALESAGDNLFDYAVSDELVSHLAIGQRIRVPLGRGNRTEIGFCVDFPASSEVEKVKHIYEIVDPAPLLNDDMIELARWIAQYYCAPLGTVLSAMVPAAVKKQVGMVKRNYIQFTPNAQKDLAALLESTKGISAKGLAIIEALKGHLTEETYRIPLETIAEQTGCGMGPFKTLAAKGLIEITKQQELARPQHSTVPQVSGMRFTLNEDQQNALDKINSIIDMNSFETILLHGVTGSGKTEVYIRSIEKVVNQGQKALMLVPEIGLTPQTVNRFLSRFPNVAILHSGMTSQQRHQNWRWIADGGADVVVGARSAVFAPMKNLGLIIVDEEHEPSYKQDTTPRYHGRDVAIKRAHMNKIPIILGSATPSLETLNNSQTRPHYHFISMPRRVLDLPMPNVTIVNMRTEAIERKGNHLLSRQLEKELTTCMKRGKQAILLLNRRGHSNYVFCPSCQYVQTCPNCDVSLTFHKNAMQLNQAKRSYVMCHYCLHATQVPASCPMCGKKIILIGPGTQKAEEEIRYKFPEARIQRVDSDTTKPAELQKVLDEFDKGNLDILIGTQMIGKGLDFPNVEVVGVLNADTALSVPDFRSSERSFQLIAQVAGRCGRAYDKGRVIVQSFVPDEPAIEYACQHDYDQFSQFELNTRNRCHMPPFNRLARLIMRDTNLEKLDKAGKSLRQQIDAINETLSPKIEVRGPMPAGIARIENYHRHEIIFKAPTAEPIQRLLYMIRQQLLASVAVQTVVDVDPINLL